LLEKNPALHIETYAVAAELETADLLGGLIDRHDLVICATDDRPSKLFINALSVAAGKTAIYGGAFRRAYGGQVIRVRPCKSACYQCFVMAMPEEAADHEVASASDAAQIAYSDRPVPIQPGLSLDVAPIALMVARLALHDLMLGQKTVLSALDRDLAAPWYLWVNRPEVGTAYQDWPPLSESSDEMTILRWYGVHLDQDPSCPTCGDFASALRTEYGLTDAKPAPPPESPPDLVVPE